MSCPIKKLLFIAILICTTTAQSQTSNKSKGKVPHRSLEPQALPEPKGKFMLKIFDWQKSFGTYINHQAEGLDRWLTGRILTYKQNPTQLIIETSSIVHEGKNPQNSVDFNLNLRLPNFEKYWQLRFTSYDDQTNERGVRGTYLRQLPRRQEYGTSLAFFREFKSIKFEFKPRLMLEDPLNISHSIIFSTERNKNNFSIKPKIEFFANPKKGTGVFTSIGVAMPIDARHYLNLINEGEYEEHMNQFTASQGFAISKILNDYSELVYSWIFVSNNRPSYHLESYIISYGYKIVLYRQFLELQITPAFDFQRIDDFQGKPLANFVVRFIF